MSAVSSEDSGVRNTDFLFDMYVEVLKTRFSFGSERFKPVDWPDPVHPPSSPGLWSCCCPLSASWPWLCSQSSAFSVQQLQPLLLQPLLLQPQWLQPPLWLPVEGRGGEQSSTRPPPPSPRPSWSRRSGWPHPVWLGQDGGADLGGGAQLWGREEMAGKSSGKASLVHKRSLLVHCL